MSEIYLPINCERHDELELLCMHRARQIVKFQQGAHVTVRKVRFDTLLTTPGEEFLVCHSAEGERLTIRLDKLIETITP